MEHKKVYALSTILMVFLFSIGVSFAQDQAKPQQEETSVVEPAVVDVQKEGAQNTGTVIPAQEQAQWLYGDVITVDAQKNTLTVKYLDYDADQEKEIVITADSQTTYENAKSLSDVKPKDTVSIDYVVGGDGKNIAKNISVEKPGGDEVALPETKVEEAKPADTTDVAENVSVEK